MRDVRIRLLYPSSARPEEVRAAIQGMERFRAYGVLHDSAVLGDNDRTALRGVRNGKAIKRMITSPDLVVGYFDFCGDVSELVFTKDIIPVGLTPSRMSEMVGEEFSTRREPRLGLSRDVTGAIVSLFRARELATMSADVTVPPFRNGIEPELALKSIELAVKHELGHVFGRTGHCEKDGCLMQANRGFADFIDRFVREGLDFCGRCSSTISCTVSRMTLQY
jgi:hypothetical protein